MDAKFLQYYTKCRKQILPPHNKSQNPKRRESVFRKYPFSHKYLLDLLPVSWSPLLIPLSISLSLKMPMEKLLSGEEWETG